MNEPSLSPVLLHGPFTAGADSNVPPFFHSMVIAPPAMLFMGEAYRRGAHGLTADPNLARGYLTAAAASADPEVAVAARKTLSEPDPSRPSPDLKNLLINPSPAPQPTTSIYERLSLTPPTPSTTRPPTADKN